MPAASFDETSSAPPAGTASDTAAGAAPAASPDAGHDGAAAEPAAAAVTAPWVARPDAFSITAATFAEVRPGWFCFMRDTQAFIAVTAVTVLSARGGKVVFIDLADGRTLSGGPSDDVFVRRSR